MAIIKCKMCGGDIELSPDKTFGTCDSCGSTMTFPKVDDEQRATAFNRGNHFRRIGEFDKALGVYESIIRQDDTDAEAHWCCALCRFGIEYVEDPATFEYLPTCHRASFDSFLEDVDYLAAVENSEGITRRQYQKDGAKIAEVQKGILKTSQSEKPFDVFICYKESDENGERTVDSTLAQDIYYQLTDKGYRVFFSRITLEDKVGTEYEPYIFAALNSAKVMLTIGTKAEYLNAVWVKNEWSRFITLMKHDRSKILIPCYRDMDPYDLPEQLSVLQSYDMSKIGFIQDLVRGIGKVIEGEKKPVAVEEKVIVKETGGPGVYSLLERAYLFLEDGHFEDADEYFDRVLDIDPKCADAYIGKLCVNRKAKRKDYLSNYNGSNDPVSEYKNNENFQKAMRFGDEKVKNELNSILDKLQNARDTKYYKIALTTFESANIYNVAFDAERKFRELNNFSDSVEMAKKCHEKGLQLQYDEALIEFNKIDCRDKGKRVSGLFSALGDYNDSKSKIQEALTKGMQADYEFALRGFETISTPEEAVAVSKLFADLGDFSDSSVKANECIEKGKEIRYNNALNELKSADTPEKANEAKKAFAALDNYKDSRQKVDECQKLFDELTNKRHLLEEKQKAESSAKKKKIIIIATIVVVLISAGAFAMQYVSKMLDYNSAMKLYEEEKFEDAIVAFENLNDFKDAKEMTLNSKYSFAEQLYDEGKYSHAGLAFYKIGDYKNAKEKSSLSWKKSIIGDTVSAGFYHTVGLKSDGTVVAVGYNHYGQCDVSDWKDIVAVSTGWAHTVGLKSDGTVVAVGDNGFGQCDVSDWTDVVAVSAGSSHTVGLKSNGTVVAVGGNYCGQCNVSDWKDIIAVSTENIYTLGLKSDGTVVAVGDNDEGQCDVSDWKDIVAISAGNHHTVGLKSDGTVVAVGYNHYGQCDVSDWRDIIAISLENYNTVGLKYDGTVVAVGDNRYGQCDVSDWKDIVAVSAGSYHTVGLKSDGTVIAVGDNRYGQCDVSDWSNIKIPD